MGTIVFLGSNKSGTSRDALKVAQEMGYEVVLLTERKKFLMQRDEFPEVSEMIYLDDMKLAEHKLKRLVKRGKEISACISFVDPYISQAAHLHEQLGLTPLSTEAFSLLENKSTVRQILKDLDSSPQFQIYDRAGEVELALPFIMKAPVSNGSKDVFLVEDEGEFRKNVKAIEPPILLEEYLVGPQYLIEVAVYKGQIHILAVIEQDIYKGERFIVTGYHFPAHLEEVVEQTLMEAITAVIRKINLENGTCHFEMRLVGGCWKLIEVNPRMSGGAMNRILLEGTGINAVKETIKMSLGEEPNFTKKFIQPVYAKFLTIGERGRLVKVTGRNRARRSDGVRDVYVKPKKGMVMTRPNSLGNRYAYVIAVGTTRKEAKENALQAAKEIQFVLERI